VPNGTVNDSLIIFNQLWRRARGIWLTLIVVQTAQTLVMLAGMFSKCTSCLLIEDMKNNPAPDVDTTNVAYTEVGK
jgi:hypothetical protein